MKILVTADWHIGVTSFGVLDEYGINSRHKDIEDTLNHIIEICKEQRVDTFIHAGDVFHTNRPTPNDQVLFLKFLYDLSSLDIDTHIIIGNHDHNNQLGKSHALKIFKEMKAFGINIYDTTTVIERNGVLFCLYPFGGVNPNFNAIAQRDEKFKALVCHSHLEGAVVGAEPFEIKDDRATSYKDLPFNAVFAGHFHKPQVLSEDPFVFYPGSIQAVDFNERLDEKGVVLVDTDENNSTFIKLRTRKLHQIDLVDTVNITLGNLRLCADAIVKVNIDLDESEISQFDEAQIRSTIEAHGCHSIASINLKIRRNLAKRDPEIKLDANIRSNFTKYMKNKDYGDLTEKITKAGYEIIDHENPIIRPKCNR